LASWKKVVPLLRAANSIVLFLDFDGTLAPISSKPQSAQLAASTRRILRRLAGQRGVRVVILSGRRRADVMARVRVSKARYLGLYGWESNKTNSLPQKTQALLERVREAVAQELSRVRGFSLEDKTHAFAVHYREADPAAVGRVRTILRKHVQKSAPGFRIVGGDKVWEIVPPEVGNKAAAIRSELRGLSQPAMAICAGDTAADEPAFAALKDAITIRVGSPRHTRARYWLRNPAELELVLGKLAETRR
jgi:trehalose-phosphatase